MIGYGKRQLLRSKIRQNLLKFLKQLSYGATVIWNFPRGFWSVNVIVFRGERLMHSSVTVFNLTPGQRSIVD
jgi:hypothetical protein